MKVGSVLYSQFKITECINIKLHHDNGINAGDVNVVLINHQPHSQAILKEIESAVKRIVNKKRG